MFKNIDKNTIIGGLIIMLMVMAYFTYSKKQIEKRAKDQKIQSALESDKDSVLLSNTTITDSVKKTAILTTDTSSNVIQSGENISLSNSLLSIDINTLGGKISNAKLKKHTSYQGKPTELLDEEYTNLDFTILTSSRQINTKNELFTVLSKTDTSIIMSSRSGLKLSYNLRPQSYILEQNWISDIKETQAIVHFETRMNRQEVNLSRERQYSTIKYLPTNEDATESLSQTSNETIEEKNSMHWVSLGQQFFNTTVIPMNGFSSAIMSSEYQENDEDYVKKYKLKANIAAQSDTIAIKYFIGPSDYNLLKDENQGLQYIVPLSQDIIIFRWMRIFNIYLIIPIFNFLSKFFSNYGLIIILMTLFIKLITAPLSYKTYKSGVAMRVLKPELDKLKAKFGGDQQKLSQEQMKLYSQYGVSPFGGCLPMLLQMPVLFAMFFFFPSSIELRHQSFLWATDLSTYDSILNLPFKIPLYGAHVSLFALLTSLTQIGMSKYSQRLQPSSPQADQMKMVMYIMPLVFLFLFNSFPAALTFYYFLQNLFSMIQQWFFTTFIIKEDKIRAEMALAKKKPKKQSGFQKKMAEIMEQAENQKKLQQNQNKK